MNEDLRFTFGEAVMSTNKINNIANNYDLRIHHFATSLFRYFATSLPHYLANYHICQT